MSEGRPAVLFDLDGTLADTAPDLALALNRLRQRYGHPPLPLERIRPQASHGSQAMVRLGFGLEPWDPNYESRRQEFLDLYAADLLVETRLFPGIPALLQALDDRGIPWAVVTNKPAWLTEPLVAALGLAQRAACIVSGDTTPNPKPHPAPVLHACDRIGIPPKRCWVLGDARRDIQAGLAAGAGTLVARFGYLDEDDDPDTWGAQGSIRTPGDLLHWLARPPVP